MKKTFLAGLATCLLLTGCPNNEPVAVESPDPISVDSLTPSPTAPAVPVQLSGSVNNQGVKDFSGVGNNIAVEFDINDFFFSPTFVKTLPGTNVTFSLTNNGQAEHTFTIGSLQVDHRVAPGGTLEAQLKLPDSGVVEFICTFHVQSGMKGAFYFQEGASAEPAPTPSPTLTADSPDTGTGSTSGGTQARRAATTAGRTTAAPSTGSSPTGAPRASQPGDLIVPDVNVGGPQDGASAAGQTPKPSPTPSVRPPAPRPGATASPKSVEGKPAPDGASGQSKEPGTSGKKGDGGTQGTDGTTSVTLIN
ncbi:MAG: cupredoxin domain-containing protein [Actinomycetota bacterium]